MFWQVLLLFSLITLSMPTNDLGLSATILFVKNTDLTLGLPEIWTVRVRQSVKLYTYSQKHNRQVTEHPLGSNKVLLEKGYLTLITELLPRRLYISPLF